MEGCGVPEEEVELDVVLAAEDDAVEAVEAADVEVKLLLVEVDAVELAAAQDAELVTDKLVELVVDVEDEEASVEEEVTANVELEVCAVLVLVVRSCPSRKVTLQASPS